MGSSPPPFPERSLPPRAEGAAERGRSRRRAGPGRGCEPERVGGSSHGVCPAASRLSRNPCFPRPRRAEGAFPRKGSVQK